MEVYVLPLSTAQKRIWYQEIIAPGNTAYNIPIGLWIKGSLDRQAWEYAFTEIVKRHEILRTTFAVEDGEPVQLVREEGSFELEEKTLSGINERTKIIARLNEEARRPFNLVTGPLMRVILYKLDSQEHILLVNMHHIVSDGWSLGILVRELTHFYLAWKGKSSESLPELPIQYGDYAEWQAEWLQQDSVKAQLSYWQGKLTGSLPVLDLPVDRARSPVQTFTGSTLRAQIPSSLTVDLELLAKSEGATLFMAVLAVYQVLLYRYSGQTDIIAGIPVANRQRSEISNLIGYFVNTLPIRGNLEGTLTFRQLLRQLSETCIEAYAHQDIPFETIVETVVGHRNPSRSPLFQTLFALQNASISEIELPGLQVTPIYLDNGGAKFDLSLILEPSKEGWLAALEYNSDIFTPDTAKRLLTFYQQLLHAVVAEPDSQIASLPLLSPGDREALLVWGQATITEKTKPANIASRFALSASSYPDRVAVKFQEATLTYRELDARSNQLARFLQEKGVSAEVRVGICQERCEELIISILAILKAGGTYIPLDPNYPAAHLKYVAEDSGMNLIVADAKSRQAIPKDSVEVVVLEEIALDIKTRSTATVDLKIPPEQAAYIIYTSGSTGKPKGCVVPHGNATRLLDSTAPWFNFTSDDVWTLFHSYAFDFSVWEIWGSLLYGAKLVVVPYWQSRSPLEFWSLLHGEKVTVLNQTPSAFQQLMRVDAEQSDRLKSLRIVIFGGEALELQSLRPWMEVYGDAYPQLVNMYGITETTVHVTYRPITLADIEANRSSPIGQAIPDLSLYVLDRTLELSPVGVVGELYVGGAGVSRGYLNRPALTAERFIPDMFGNGTRLYRTGDLARRLPDGDLEYLGRSDFQVKIRGFRIELGEIEAALAALPSVAEAIAIAPAVDNSDKRLVAYIVNKNAVTSEELRTALTKRLPEHAIPAAFVFLDRFPLTPQGKVDRRALPIPDWKNIARDRLIIPPETPAQQAICTAWERVLALEAVGIEDNFFALGGDSILAVKVVTQMRRQGWIITPKEIFEHQNVKALAAAARKQEITQSLSPKGNPGDVPLSPIQQWFFDLEVPAQNHWNQAVLLKVHPAIAPQTIAKAIAEVAIHHDTFRLRFRRIDRGWQQFYSEVKNAPTLDLEIVDLTASADREAEILRHCERLQRSLDLSNGPLARAALMMCGEGDGNRLFVVIHHAIVDGVSWRILLEDLGTVLMGGVIEPPASSFQQWSEFLRVFASRPEVRGEITFWQRNIKTNFKLPLDFADKQQNREATQEKVSLTLTPETTQIFLTSANKAYRTQPQDLLLAALSKTLQEITSENVLQIIMEGHGREDLSANLDVTRTLGWFTTIYPLRLDLPDNSLATILKTVKESLRSLPHRGLSYGVLRYLSKEAEVNSPIHADISFNYLGQVRVQEGKDQLFSLLDEANTGIAHDPDGLRPHVIDVVAIVVSGKLRVDWLYSNKLHRRETICQWAEIFEKNLLSILSYCTTPGIGGYTLSDFAWGRTEPKLLSQENLDELQRLFPDIEDIYPLSPLQEGMLFHEIYDRESHAYFEQITGKFTDKFDCEAFAAAWQAVLERHAIFRTAFVWENLHRPLQIVQRSASVQIVERDWRDLSPERQTHQLERYLNDDRDVGFALNRPPLMRLTVIRLQESVWQWVWSHHHLLLDGWSIQVVFHEVLVIYKSMVEKVRPTLELAPLYRHYLQWISQRNRLQAEQFWQENLAGIDGPTRMSWKQQNGEGSSYAEVELRIQTAEFNELQVMAQNYHLTVNTLTQGAWALNLQKHGAGDDVIFGVTVSGRPPELPDVEKMVGLFVNTLPLRARISPEIKVATWLQQIQRQQAQVREYEYSKLIDIQHLVNLSGDSLFDSILVFENYPVDLALKDRGSVLGISDIQFYERTNYPLTVAAIPEPEGLLLKLSYQTAYLSPSDAEILLQRLQQLLLKLARQAEEPVGAVSLLSIAERSRAISEWNATLTDWGEFRCAHQLFEDQVDIDPEAIAVVWEEESISYGELETRANGLADTLAADIGRESIVALYLEPSIDFIAALLAVMKVGAAFLPLDPNYPKERLQLILSDSSANAIIALEKPSLNLPSGCRPIALSEIKISSEASRPDLTIEATQMAYTIYTSGSTGKPKGVTIAHAGVQNLLHAQAEMFAVTRESRIYQFASLSFDAAISEIFMALGNGARLYVKKPENRMPSPALWSALTAWGITHITLPPSLAEAIDPEDLPTLKTLILAGEAAPETLFCQWSNETRKLVNAYGPTEATVCTSMMDCSQLQGPPSIGRAMANMETYLLDDYLEPVPPGVPGELYIGGMGLARGYLGRPDLTASAFIPNPFSQQPGARLYRSGDKGIWDEKGNIYFQGRLDDRVKVRGHRIELGEIEVTLQRHPGVKQAVTIAREDQPGIKRLVAYVRGDSQLTPEILLSYLSGLLPSYMIPNAVVLLSEWPLTPNGKIDRQSLPAPAVPIQPEDATLLTDTEKILARVWSDVLGVETVGPDANFFALGGDSIVSLQIVSRAREAGLDISPKDIFVTQTLSGLASQAKALPVQKPVEEEPQEGFVPLSPIQNWFFSQNLPHPQHWNQTIALRCTQPLEVPVLTAALEALVAQHGAFRLAFSQDRGKWKQYYAGMSGIPPLRVEDFSRYDTVVAQNRALAAIAQEEQESFDLSRPPLLRVLYVQNFLSCGNVLLLFGHHLVMDGVSWRIAIEDLFQAYRQVLEDKLISLSQKTASYRQWTSGLQTLASSTEIEEDRHFWQETVAVTSTIPVDLAAGPDANTVESLAVETRALSPEETTVLQKETIAVYKTGIEEIMLAALLQTMTAWTGETYLRLDMEGYGRQDLGVDISRTIGWFTSLYPVLLKKPVSFAQASAPADVLKAVKQQMRSVPHNGISFGLLRYLHPDRSFRESLALQKAPMSFNYLGQTDNRSEGNQLLEMTEVPTGMGMFVHQQRPHLLAINARIQEGQLMVEWGYSKLIHYQHTIATLAEKHLQYVRTYLNSMTKASDFYVKSDFSQVDLGVEELDALLTDLED